MYRRTRESVARFLTLPEIGMSPTSTLGFGLALVRDMDAAYRNSSEGEGLSEEERPCSVVITSCSVVISACSEGEGLQQRGLTLP